MPINIPCPACGRPIDVAETVGRRETCPLCSADLHACIHCEHYDRSAYNECREPQADRVVEKDKSNFCDFFRIRSGGGGKSTDPKAAARSKLDSLFKKG